MNSVGISPHPRSTCPSTDYTRLHVCFDGNPSHNCRVTFLGGVRTTRTTEDHFSIILSATLCAGSEYKQHDASTRRSTTGLRNGRAQSLSLVVVLLRCMPRGWPTRSDIKHTVTHAVFDVRVNNVEIHTLPTAYGVPTTEGIFNGQAAAAERGEGSAGGRDRGWRLPTAGSRLLPTTYPVSVTAPRAARETTRLLSYTNVLRARAYL